MSKPFSKKILNALSKTLLIEFALTSNKQRIFEAKRADCYQNILQDVANCFSLENWTNDTIVEDIHCEVSEIQDGIKKWHGGTGNNLLD